MAIALASYEGIISCLGMILGFIYPLSFRFHKYGFTGLYTDSRIAYLSAESKRIRIAAIENGRDRWTADQLFPILKNYACRKKKYCVIEYKGENGGFATLVFAIILLSNTRRHCL